MRRIEAGEMLAAPVRAPIAATRAVAPVARDGVPIEERVPQRFGWMCASGPNVRRDGEAFVEWLNQPATQAIVLAAPERMARLIGPILTATGQRRPGWFPLEAKRFNISWGRAAFARPPSGKGDGISFDMGHPSSRISGSGSVAI
jgi:hypothetical protein